MKYKLKHSETMKAVLWTGKNINEILTMTDEGDEISRGLRSDKLRVKKGESVTYVYVGECLVRNEDGSYGAIGKADLERLYIPVE